MKKLRFIGNIIFFSLVVYFVGQSVNVFLGKRTMQTSLANTDAEIKELTNKKNKLLDQEKNSDEDEKTEKFARNNLNLKKEGEETYKITE
ncbi:septum formation initiator [Leptotrichia shahii]|jgi:septum formation initiator|uniref:Septum formation initiator n=1 Tax=Leptotrichia shahii TaxID=157691 RepID=A0A510JP45_9FUSO|nr:septum formation initiator family protein [Leptotrichia shahii]BBM41132.1 septum formation initiator [Leptotrichia shahii]